MPALTHPYDSDAFWQAVATRLTPLLGDVQAHFGEFWFDHVEMCFSRGDFETVACAEKRLTAPRYLLSLDAGADRLADAVDDLLAGTTEAECVGALLDLCRECDQWPTTVSRQADVLQFLRDDTPFAQVGLVPAAPALAPATRSRAEHALGRLHKQSDSDREFARRLKRWPGLAAVVPKEDTRGGQLLHWPSPAEWLVSARRLWSMAGVPDASTAQAQQLAAAIFDAPGWHQLCGLMPGASDAQWWALQGPFYTYTRSQFNYAGSVFAGAEEAFANFAGRAAIVCAGSTDAYCAKTFPAPRSRLPCLMLQPAERSGESYEDWRLREMSSEAVSMQPVDRVDADPQSVAAVASPLLANDLPGLLACFTLDPQGDSYGNRIFHRASFDGLVCTGSVTRSGPYVSCGERWYDGVPLGRCILRKFQPSTPDGGARAAGWWLVKDWNDAKLDLTHCTDAQIRQLSDEFGIAIFSEAHLPGWQGQQAQFYASPAWEALQAWQRAHVALAEELGQYAPYLPGWSQNVLHVAAP